MKSKTRFEGLTKRQTEVLAQLIKGEDLPASGPMLALLSKEYLEQRKEPCEAISHGYYWKAYVPMNVRVRWSAWRATLPNEATA